MKRPGFLVSVAGPPGWILVVPRIFLGVIFTIAVYGKLTAQAPFKAIIGGFLTHVLPNANPLYQSLMQAVVLPNAGLFAFLVIASELYVAIAMLLGITTRLASVVAVFMLANYMLAKGASLWTPSSNDAADIILAAVAARWPRVPLW
jgi:thiosulfate dehydrogenase (quinone) large subunit